MALLEEEIIERTAALVESLYALSGVLALALASTPRGEISACEIDALTDLSYKIHLNLSGRKYPTSQQRVQLESGRILRF